MDTLLQTVRSFFDARNEAWVTGEIDSLRGFATDEGVHRIRHDLALRQRALAAYGTHVVRAHTRLTVLETRSTDAGDTEVLAREKVWWVHREDGGEWVEGRVIQHWQRWRPLRGGWRLTAHRATDEGTPSPDPAAGRGGGNRRESESHPVRLASPEPVWAGPRAICTGYDRVRAMRYAELWWDGFNPAFERFEDDDCTNFVSQCLLAGGMRMTGGQRRDTGWWYRFASGARPASWSFSWSVSHALYQYLTQHAGAQRVQTARALRIGDLIFYDWDGQGRYDHTTVVVDFDPNGDPLVNAHTDPSYHRPYRYLDSRAWTPRTRYAFVHLPEAWC